MILFFDWVSSSWYIAIYSNDRKLIHSERFSMAWNESSKSLSIISTFLNSKNIEFRDVQEILCVNGPGSFTWIRTISLVINTISFMYPHITLTPISIFDLYWDLYPLVFPSSKRDLFVKYEKWAIIEVVKNEDFESKTFDNLLIYGELDISRFKARYILDSNRDYDSFVQYVVIQNMKRIAPLYMKKPTIS